MLRNYFIVALRQLKKQRMYSAIKIGGFALSIAACLLIGLFIRQELSYDKSYPEGDRLYRCYGAFDYNEIHEKGSAMPPPTAQVIRKDFPEVEASGRLMASSLFEGAGSNQVSTEQRQESTYDEGFSYLDQSMLDMLQLPMVYGNRSTALAEPNTIVLTRRKAEKYFPGENPIGKMIFLNNDKTKPYKVGGVIENNPANSHLQYDFYLTLTGKELWPGEQESWNSSNYDVYLKLKPGVDPKVFEKKVTADIIDNYVLPNMLKSGQADAEKLARAGRLILQPISEVHLYSNGIQDGFNHGDIRFVWLFGAIACFILVLACINFINLSTAKSANRAKEVGLRKVVGSQRESLMFQFLTESVLYSLLSFVLAIILALLLLPYFNQLSGKNLTMPWNDWWFIPLLLGGALLVGIAAGLYPSLYLSSFKPVAVLKGEISRGAKGSLLRNSLVIFQFTTSIILIIGTIVIYRQMDHIMNAKLGFDKDQVLLLESTHTLGDQVKSFKNELKKIPQVKNASISDFLPVSGSKRNGNSMFNEGKTTEEMGASAQVWIVDDDYLPTMGMQLVSGRNLSFDFASDSMGAVINQTMAAGLGIKEAKDQRITNGWETFHVVGIVKDFNFESVKTKVSPLMFRLGNSTSVVSVKIKPDQVNTAMAAITATWKKFAPNQTIRYTFLDEQFARMYEDVLRMQKIFTSFSILAIFIACLGLFALSAFMAEQRKREIGIRKVLGASVGQVTTLLSTEFVRLVLIALVIACPVAWWAMNNWLEDFSSAYRISITWWMFGIAGLLVISIAIITVSFQSIQAALKNPVNTLRSQ